MLAFLEVPVAMAMEAVPIAGVVFVVRAQSDKAGWGRGVGRGKEFGFYCECGGKSLRGLGHGGEWWCGLVRIPEAPP